MIRDAKAEEAWKDLSQENERPALSSIAIGADQYDFSAACTVIGGKNGVGKSRLLRNLAQQLGQDAVFVDLHHLSEQAMILLRSRDDEEGAVEDVGMYLPSPRRVDDLVRIVGRQYSSVEWADLELEPYEPDVAKSFEWSRDQSYVPYFRVEYNGRLYSGRDMGLGEFTVHFLFWIIEQYRDKPGLTLLLDEPDAFLPPVGVKRLLLALLAVCAERGWQLILSTHSDEMIRNAVEHDAFVLLSTGEDGEISVMKTDGNRSIASFLLSRPPITTVIYCEDESAFYIIDSMIRNCGSPDRRSVAIAWGNGNGDLVTLRERIPHPSRFEIGFVFVFDGDQWDETKSTPGAWPARFIPTGSDPDELFRNSLDVNGLAMRLGKPVGELRTFLESIEGEENHDWTNKLAEQFGRSQTLTILADHWVLGNKTNATEFCRQLQKRDEFLLHSTQKKLKRAAEAARSAK